MLDPDEGLHPDGTIRTGARRDRVPSAFEPVLAEAVRDLVAAGADEVLLYGSVATGRAVVGRSDVDLLVSGVPLEGARHSARRLSTRFADLCREVAVGVVDTEALRAEGDAGHGDRVFLRHYCVPVHGPDGLRGKRPYPGDVRAARGFNGDLARHLALWRTRQPDVDLGRRLARKTLLAVAGLVSVHDVTWTTDRVTAAHRWGEVEPTLAQPLSHLLGWSQDVTPLGDDVAAALHRDGVVEQVVRRFAADIGLWDQPGSRAPASR